MKLSFWILFLFVVFLSFIGGCEKFDSYAFSVRITLENKKGEESYSFLKGDTLVFMFYLTNRTGESAEFYYPYCRMKDFLRTHKEDSVGVYNYIGNPNVACPNDAEWSTIKNGKTMLVGTFELFDSISPLVDSGSFFVGDVFSMRINGKERNFVKRIYFEII